ncbi:hypothetical protein OC844_004958 [Tilletia horrida]|nr:hypothetical protein OC844_004958 [Tilletia horrida]
MFEEDGFEIIEDPSRAAPPPAPTAAAAEGASASASARVQAPAETGSAPCDDGPAPLLPVGSLVLELGGERKRMSSAAMESAQRDKPRLLLFLHRSAAAGSSSSASAGTATGMATIWRRFDQDLAEEQRTLPWRTTGCAEDVEPRRSAGEAQAALRALHALIARGEAEAEWAMGEVRENAQRLPAYQLVVRVSLRAQDDGERRIKVSEPREAPAWRKHLMYALRRDEAASSTAAGFSVAAAVRAAPIWLLQDSDEDVRTTLRELYNRIPPPAAEPWLHVDARTQQTMRELIEDDATPGIQTRLFRYQRRTVAQLLRRERNVIRDTIPDPRLVPCAALDGTRFFIDIDEHQLWLFRQTLPDMAGSILCEHMGLGKTLECIALIVLTRGERSTAKAPGRIIRERHSGGYENGDSDDEEGEENNAVERRRSFLCRTHAIERPEGRHHAPRVAFDAIPPLRIYRTFTTLVCVPMELLRQWMEQLEEHLALLPELVVVGSKAAAPGNDEVDQIEQVNDIADRWREERADGDEYSDGDDAEGSRDQGEAERSDRGANGKGKGKAREQPCRGHAREKPLRVLVLLGSTDAIPAADKLAKFDIILLTSGRLQAEWDRCGGLKLRWPGVKRRCHCSYSGKKGGCNCPASALQEPDKPLSPLMQVMFRRIIVDEGHILSSASSNLVLMSRSISSQSRLMVSGTPTANLVGSAPEDIGKGLPPPSADAHVWSESEGKDLARIGLLLQNSLLHPVFTPLRHSDEEVDQDLAAAKRDWAACMLGPLNLKQAGLLPDFGAVQRLREIFSTVFVRSGNEARDEAALPRCVDNVAELTMNAAERVNYNAIQALIGLNSISLSDSYFDKGNEKYAAEVTKNIKLAAFWFFSPDFERWARLALLHPGYLGEDPSPERLEQQSKAFFHLRKALDEIDINGRLGQSLRYYLPSIDDSICTWTSSRPRNDELPINLNCASLVKIRQAMHRINDLPENQMLDVLRVYHRIEIAGDEAGAEDLAAEQQGQGEGGHLADEEKKDGDDAPNAPGSGPRPQSGAADKIIPAAKPDDRKAKKLKCDFDNTRITHDLQVPRPIARAKILATSSTKLSFVLNYIHKLPPGDKVAIFSSLRNVRTEVADVLDAAQIRFVMHSPEVSKKEHVSSLRLFREADNVCVIIMDYRSGGRGHNIQVANHCLLLEPVWSPDDELQAIKRFHRLGQKKEVHVTTLVMKNTFEQEIVSRRRAIKRELADGTIATYVSTSDGAGKRADLLADPSMRQFLSRARYITAEHGHTRPEPFTRIGRPIYPFAHIHPRTGRPLLDDEDDELMEEGAGEGRQRANVNGLAQNQQASQPPPQPPRIRGGPSALAGARRQNLAALELQQQHAQEDANWHKRQSDGAAAGSSSRSGMSHSGHVKREEVEDVGERRNPIAGPSSKRARFV